jgi:small subunit ribosomal protein S9
MSAATKKTTDQTTEAASGPYVYAVGKRKTAIARLKLFRGKGDITVNEKDAKKYFTIGQHLASFLAPFKVASVNAKDYDLEIKVIGGGPTAQAEACRHGLATALQKEDESRRTALKQAGFLTRDARVKERKKPGLKGARRAPQWAKR